MISIRYAHFNKKKHKHYSGILGSQTYPKTRELWSDALSSMSTILFLSSPSSCSSMLRTFLLPKELSLQTWTIRHSLFRVWIKKDNIALSRTVNLFRQVNQYITQTKTIHRKSDWWGYFIHIIIRFNFGHIVFRTRFFSVMHSWSLFTFTTAEKDCTSGNDQGTNCENVHLKATSQLMY